MKPMSAVTRNLNTGLIIGAVLLWSAAITMLVMGWGRYASWQADYQRARTALQQIKSANQALADELRVAREVRPEFERLKQRQIVGSFAKQRVLDQLESDLRSGLVRAKSYALAAEAPLSGAAIQGLTQYQAVQHSVSLEAQALHEGRIVALAERLTRLTDWAVPTVESCEVSRVAAAESGGGVRPSTESGGQRSGADLIKQPLALRCMLNWYRFAEAAANTPGPLGGPLVPGGSSGGKQ